MKRYMQCLYKFLVLCCSIFFVQNALAQVTGDQYRSYYLDDKNDRISRTSYSCKESSGDANDSTNVKEKAVDGSEGTNWKSRSEVDEPYIILKFENDDWKNIKGFEIYVKEANRRGAELIVSSSDRTADGWTEVARITNFNESDRHKVLIDATKLKGQYLRLRFIKQKDQTQVNINEVYFYKKAYTDIATYEVKHKYAKWYDLRNILHINAADNFDEDEADKWNMGYDGTTKIQAAHTLIDTIYVHKGTTVTLTLPDYINGTANNKTYQRWYDYITDGTFATTGDTGSGDVVDLLTPAASITNGPINGEGYRFKNGYIGQPLSGNYCLYRMNFYVPNEDDKDWYLVACDVSGYKDYTDIFKLNESKNSKFIQTLYEPTLAHRFIYFIRAISDTNSPAYKALKAGHPIDEKTITMPATRLPDKTREMVALSMDARSFLTPTGAKTEAEGNLTVSLAKKSDGTEDNSAGIKLVTKTLKGESRVIFFDYPNTNSDNTQSVNSPTDGSDPTATIEVNRGDTVVARYHLVFKEEDRLLTQTQVSQENEKADSKYRYRMPDYLKENYELLTELNFDFDDAVAEQYGQKQCYPFPIGWESSTYGFYDGSAGSDYQQASSAAPEWGYYGILNSYVECHDKDDIPWAWRNNNPKPKDDDPIRYNSKGNPSTYHLFADASDRPGVLARLPFDRKLCRGTELFVTAWVKSARGNDASNDAAVLFTIMGVKKRDVGTSASTKDYVPIYRYQTGQIPSTYKNFGKLTVPGFDLPNATTKTHNEWMQVYFSFINTDNSDFESYVLQVDNNSASTEGGDIYIDDVRVYMIQPNAKVSQLEATCTSEQTLMSAELNWNQLMSRLGHEEGVDKGTDAIDFCFIDETKYNAYLAQEGKADDYAGAIEASVVAVGNDDVKYRTLYFDLEFNKNKKYQATSEDHNLASNNGDGEGHYYFYGKTSAGGIRSLAVDFYSLLEPNRPYVMLINTHVPSDTELNAEDFALNINDACAIKTTFYVTTETMLRVNGQVVDPSTDFCAGQIFNFSVNVRVPTDGVNADGTTQYIEVKDGVYFDWFFGSEDEFVNADPDGVSLQDALSTFREIFPDKVDLTDVQPGTYRPEGSAGEIELTDKMIQVIEKYLNDTGEADGIHNRLVLHKENLNITLLQSGLNLIVQPIPLLEAPSESGVSDSLWAKVCWEYIPLKLNTSGEAPQLHAGFNSVKYPADDFNPSLRIGLAQIESTSATAPMTIDLRGATLVSPSANHLGLITSSTPDVFDKIYLVSTNDPAYDQFFDKDFNEYSLPIGTITLLQAAPYATGSSYDDKMQIYFDTQTKQSNGFQFQPKEGYTYTFAVHFEEKGSNGESSNACFGSFVVPMKVVPENVVWKGNASGTSNWNNDKNWMRADKTDLKKTDKDVYLTNEANTTSKGFVPMLFTNVIMPRNSKAELYMAGYAQGGDGEGDGWVNSSRPDYMELPTDSIQYDLMAYEKDNALTTQRYRVNICRDIHFEPGAQMLHAEDLLYNKAWTDVEVESGKWTLVSTPLKDVVAGDWYVPTTGKQATEYFKDITFADGVYNRLNPAIYQRSWSKGANIVEQGGTTTPVSFATEWSSVYNDASVPYSAGAGFSLKAVSDKNPLLFRFPKADTEYNVAAASLNRDQAGKLLVSSLINRSNPYVYNPQTDVKVTLKPSPAAENGARYLMVGNPFMTSLDVRQFVEANDSVLAQKYWYVTADGNTKADVLEDGDWTAPDAYQAAPYSVFYVQVQAVDPNAAEISVKFTADMQVAFTQASGTASASQARALQIEAAGSHGSSQALLSYSAQADNACAGEDAVLLSNLSGNATAAPQVYTVAGNTAVSVNWLKDAQQIPLGVFAATEDDEVTLTFTGLGALRSPRLYDAELNTETPLSEGYQLTVMGSSHGRYFILTEGGALTGISAAPDAEADLTAYSVRPGEVILSAPAGISRAEAYGADGRLLRPAQTAQSGSVWRLTGLTRGTVVVQVTLTDGTQPVRKVMVR